MTNYREILRLDSLGYNHKQIADSMSVSRQTVVSTLQRSKQCGLAYAAASTMSDRDIARKLYPQGEGGKPLYKMPDCEYVHKELQKPGVTIMLLWQEYADKCRQNGELRIRRRNSASTITTGHGRRKLRCTSTGSPES